jgi:iron complex transport system substrate-binding protein
VQRLARRPLTAALVAAFALLPGALPAAEYVDATGRAVEVPEVTDRVFAAGSPAGALLYVLKPEAMINWPHAPTPEQKALLRPEYRDLPELPELVGEDGAVNLAALRQADPDLVVDFGTVNERYIEAAERVQAEGGVPYLLIDGSLDATPAALRQLGAALGVADRGTELAAYAEETLALVDATLAKVPEAERPRIYLARGTDGLTSGRRGSINAEALERVGAINVVESGGERNFVEV